MSILDHAVLFHLVHLVSFFTVELKLVGRPNEPVLCLSVYEI